MSPLRSALHTAQRSGFQVWAVTLPRGRGRPRGFRSKWDVVEMLLWEKEEKTSFWRKRNLDINGKILGRATRWGQVLTCSGHPTGPWGPRELNASLWPGRADGGAAGGR